MNLASFAASLLATATQIAATSNPRAAEPPGCTALTTGGLVWSYYVPYQHLNDVIPFGDRAGQVPVVDWDVPTSGWRKISLLSSFDAHPPTEIVTISGTTVRVVAASETDDYLQIIHRYRDLTTASCVRKFSSRSEAIAWRFDFGEQGFPELFADISRDGRTIVSAYAITGGYETHVRVHDPATGEALQSFVMPYRISRMDLSPDGSLCVLTEDNPAGPGLSFVVDVATASVMFTATGTTPRRQALSEDGRVLAISNRDVPVTTHHFQVFVRGPGGYQLVLDVPTPPELFLTDWAVSENGSTVVAAWGRYDPPHQVMVRAYDVATATMTMERVQPASAMIQARDVAISADGSRFAVGLIYDGSAEHAELAVYRRDSSLPLAEHPLGGAVAAVDISPDGKRYVAARRPTNDWDAQSWEFVELYELGGEDFVVRGRPSLGASVTFELHGTPGARAMLLRSFALAPNPIDVPGVGRLHLDPASLVSEPMETVPPSGPATLAVTLAHLPGMTGRTLYYQGLTTQPRSLTRDWVQLTIVP